ncbi:MAG: hypothetical protein DI589_03820 [Shinella sp.]|nr:MAG: hypothetical protein DI589_03820 [Shinella sp.]
MGMNEIGKDREPLSLSGRFYGAPAVDSCQRSVADKARLTAVNGVLKPIALFIARSSSED